MLKFLGIGAQKAGTSWLHAQLARHPQIRFPLGKEAHFWDRPQTPQTLARYLAAFADEARCEGDITPAYAMLSERTIREIHRTVPALRLIYIVRDPVERAWSAALMALARAELEVDEVGEQWFIDHFRSAGSLARGDYATALRRWRAVFGETSLLVLRFDDIQDQPETVLRRCCAHLGIDAPDEHLLSGCREPVFRGPGVQMPTRLRAMLTELYRPRMAALERELGRGFADWLDGGTPAVIPAPRRTLWARVREHRRERQQHRVLARSGLFDAGYYLNRYPDVRRAGLDPLRHYLRHGAAERRNPSAAFDTAGYLAAYPDVAESGINPLLHYALYGAAEGRRCAVGVSPGPVAQRPATAIHAAATPAARPAPAARPLFRDFGGYARNTLFHPELRAPFTEEARCVLGHMRAVQIHLRQRHAHKPGRETVSVIVTARAAGAGVDRAVRSVLAQSWASVEVIVVGTGATTARLTSFDDPRLRDLGSDGKGGLGAALQRGWTVAKGAFFAFADADASFDPDFVRIMVGELIDHPEFELAYCAQSQLGTEAEPVAVRHVLFQRALLENHPCIDLRCVVLGRQLAQRLGGFDDQMDQLAGWDLLLRATAQQTPLRLACPLSHVYAPMPAAASIADDARHRADLQRIDAKLSGYRLDQRVPGCSVPGIEKLYGVAAPVSDGTPHARKVAIIIPSFECLEHLRLCVESVHAFTDPPFELIIVDNASSPPVREYLQTLAQSGRARTIQNDHNFGFSYAVNQGIAAADAQSDVILLNNDAAVTEGWVVAMQQVLRAWPDTGLVVPRQVLPAGTPTIQTHNPAMTPAREAEVNLSLHHDNVLDPLFDAVRGYAELAFAPFFCVYIPRRTLDEVGVLDHENAPHYRSDRLYCDAVRHIAGRRIVYTPHAKLYHFLQRATKELRSNDPQMFQGMFVKNEWAAVSRGAPPAGSGG